jgi:diphthine synthase
LYTYQIEVCENMSKGQLIFIGLGLFDGKDVSIRGLDELKNCDKVFAEFYTSKLTGFDKNSFEKQIGKSIEILSREETERGNKILEYASKNKVAFLTCGDPMIATTHIDLRLQAIKSGIETKIIHSSSIVTAVPGLLGLQNYKFGRTTTLAFPEKKYFPTSPYDVIKKNKAMGLHTLILLDIQAERDVYMTANQGMALLLQMGEKLEKNIFDENSIICVVARAGSPNPVVVANTFKTLIEQDFGPPLHTLAVPGTLHFMEIEALEVCAGLPPELGKKLQKL